MDIFQYREDLIRDYSAYVKGFLAIQDPVVDDFVVSRLDRGSLWPEPLVQLNPAFVEGPTIDELVDQKTLHPTCREIFRRDKSAENPEGTTLRLHWHQAQALACVQRDVNYVLTTGTGSGKSLAYLIPIINHVLKTGSGHGIQAIVVYADQIMSQRYQFSHRDAELLWSASVLLRKAMGSDKISPAQLVTLAKLQHILSVSPRVTASVSVSSLGTSLATSRHGIDGISASRMGS